MCIRYNPVDARWERWINRKKIQTPFPLRNAPDRGIFPGDLGNLMRLDAENRQELVEARWGLQPFWANSATVGKRYGYNARAEGSEERAEGIENMRLFREPFRERRCVIPAVSFYERVGPTRGQTWVRVRPPEEEPLLLAGLWSPPNKWTDLPTYSLVTIQPPEKYFYDRMPVLLAREEAEQWMSLEAPLGGLKSLLTANRSEELIVEEYEPVEYRPRKNSAQSESAQTLF